ncbi:hypothetical protein HQQ80_01830 [Microbacteriaceae bacterium VKM Ac-2855]|nr:hypothetical protein [Microbacteriaceae bacterium VKM Ac-2855]
MFPSMRDSVAEAFWIARNAGIELLAVSSICGENALGSANPWIFGFRADPVSTAGSIHPKEAGMSAVADELIRFLDG